jgi:nitrate reductase molybdenum cofactor assembly chaperone NarJ/NarW
MIGSMGTETRAVAAKAVSLLLRYPDRAVLAALPALRAVLPDLPERLAERLSIVERHRATGDPSVLAKEYVELFESRRRCCLQLSYYTPGGSRKLGEALMEFAAAYPPEGLAITDREPPDYLPAVLDLAAHDGVGWELLRRHRHGLDLLSQALRGQHSVYRHAVDAVGLMLTAPAAAERSA